jgi:hypothetical protein
MAMSYKLWPDDSTETGKESCRSLIMQTVHKYDFSEYICKKVDYNNIYDLIWYLRFNKHDKEVFGKTDSLKHPVSLFMHDWINIFTVDI